MGSFWNLVNRVIYDADVILLIMDSRFVDETRHQEIERKVKSINKPLIYVMTKCDLADKSTVEKFKKKFNPAVFVSSKEYFGMTLLRESILAEAQKAGIVRRVRVGVLGYPNVGKSSLINAMKGRKSAPTSSVSGFTKKLQKIRAGSKIMFLDTPGVLPYEEKDKMKQIFVGSIDFAKIKEPDLAAIELMKRYPGKVEHFYGVKVSEDKEETLEEIAVKKNMLKKGGKPDLHRMAAVILQDWQKGAIR